MKLNTVRLRVMLGFLAILLPIIVLSLSLIFGYGIPHSISATYYLPPCITPFMIILGASSIMLMAYRGYTKVDDIILTCAGIMGLLICLCPCSDTALAFVGTFMLSVAISSMIHNIAAIIFFVLLAYNSIFLFTKTDGNMTRNKKIRNIIYIICGIGMIASFGILLLPWFHGQILVTEAVALFFFGVSFLTKADAFKILFCDTKFNEADD